MAGGIVLEAIYNGNTELYGIIHYVAKKKKTEIGQVAANVQQVLDVLVESHKVRRIQKRKNNKVLYFITKEGRDAFEAEKP